MERVSKNICTRKSKKKIFDKNFISGVICILDLISLILISVCGWVMGKLMSNRKVDEE